jgi:MFS family permease
MEGDNKRHFQMSIVWPVVGIAWGTMAYSYAGSIIGTTLGGFAVDIETFDLLSDSYLGQPSFFKYMGLDTNPHASALIGTMTGLFYAGGVFGCILNAWMADKFGRKWTAIFASVIVTIATACLAGSVNIGMFIAFRFFVGVGYVNSRIRTL